MTIQANDKPSISLCSRCGSVITGRRIVIVEWNGLEFRYCPECQLSMKED